MPTCPNSWPGPYSRPHSGQNFPSFTLTCYVMFPLVCSPSVLIYDYHHSLSITIIIALFSWERPFVPQSWSFIFIKINFFLSALYANDFSSLASDSHTVLWLYLMLTCTLKIIIIDFVCISLAVVVESRASCRWGKSSIIVLYPQPGKSFIILSETR